MTPRRCGIYYGPWAIFHKSMSYNGPLNALKVEFRAIVRIVKVVVINLFCLGITELT